MPREHDPTFTLENFGPIRAGSFTLRPLTVFIGPNNTGKSYTATLVYALARHLVRPLDLDRFLLMSLYRRREVNRSSTRARMDLPDQIRLHLESKEEHFPEILSERAKMALEQYFETHFLASTTSETPVSIQVRVQDREFFSIVVEDELSFFLAKEFEPRVQEADWPGDYARFSPRFDAERWADLLIEDAWIKILHRCGVDFEDAWYLPPARSGFLAGWPLLTSLTIDFVRQAIGRNPVSISSLSGTAGDFVQLLLNLIATAGRGAFPTETKALGAPLEVLEQHVLQGTIETPRSQRDLGDLQYVTGGLRLPVHRSSSMVGELAPLDLVMRRLLRPGDLLVMDEPEAHLHPENQRRIARVLARLAVAGVTVIAPTHSPTIIHQLSNLVRASQLDDAAFRELGLDESDRIGPEMVGVYVFQSGENGSVIREVEFDPEFGYPEDEFLDVAESLSRQSYQIDEKHPVTA